jgi:hypothetical protein
MPPRAADDRLVKWLDAETEYQEAVKAFRKGARSRAIKRSDVLALVEVRARADKHRDKYLNKALPARAR